MWPREGTSGSRRRPGWHRGGWCTAVGTCRERFLQGWEVPVAHLRRSVGSRKFPRAPSPARPPCAPVFLRERGWPGASGKGTVARGPCTQSCSRGHLCQECPGTVSGPSPGRSQAQPSVPASQHAEGSLGMHLGRPLLKDARGLGGGAQPLPASLSCPGPGSCLRNPAACSPGPGQLPAHCWAKCATNVSRVLLRLALGS